MSVDLSILKFEERPAARERAAFNENRTAASGMPDAAVTNAIVDWFDLAQGKS
jgi:hypothetical protein